MAGSNVTSDLADDYYAWLGIDKTATAEEINKAYRTLSRSFHPDKHQDETKKLQAFTQFNKIKKAYEVLKDPVQRAIYDAVGSEGLKMEGWKLQERFKSPKEILEEMEKLKAEEEEKKLRLCTNPKGSMLVGLNATDLFDSYEYNIDYPSLLPSIEISETHIKQSVECPLTKKDTVFLSGLMHVKNGKGSSDVGVRYRKLLTEQLTGETDIHIGSKPSIAFSCFRSLWTNGSGNIGLQFQMAPDGSLVPFYSLNLVHQFDKNIQGRLAFIAGANSGVNTSLAYVRGSHLVVLGCQVGIPVSLAHCQYSYDLKKYECKLKMSAKLTTLGWVTECSCSKKVTKFSDLSACVTVGSISGVILRVSLHRGQQTFSSPIHLSDTPLPSAIFYATLVPLVTYFIARKFVIDPIIAHHLHSDVKAQKEKHFETLKQRKQDASDAVDLMCEVINKSYEVEEACNGLVIVEALYGKMEDGSTEVVDVTRCLQAMVKNSSLSISSYTSLHSLPGFYDPCFGEEKRLTVTYRHGGVPRCHTFHEGDVIALPSDDHPRTEIR